MEQAPPPPKYSSRHGSPKIYMTPQLAKQREGIRPSLLDVHEGEVKSMKAPVGGSNKPYRTSSLLLLQVQEKPGESREISELQTLTDSISSALKEIVEPIEGEIISLSFKPEGCVWKMDYSANLNGADKNFRVEVVLYANSIAGVTNYEIDAVLVPKVPIDPNPNAPALKGFKEAKATFDILSLAVRKAVVKLEFPEFPEGCKDKSFREVYQLNARVRIINFEVHCLFFLPFLTKTKKIKK